MFCPQCHAEFVPGFTRCDECDVELVEELLPERERRALRGLLHRLLPPKRDENVVPAEPKTPLARRPLVLFFALTGAVYVASVAFAATRQDVFDQDWLNRLHDVSWLVIGLVALVCCWAISGPRDRPPRRLAQLSVAVAVKLLAMAGLALESWVQWFAYGVGTVEHRSWRSVEFRHLLGYAPGWLQALGVGLVLAGTLSPFPAIRRTARALLAWRGAQTWRLVGLALLVPAASAATAAIGVLLITATGSRPLTFQHAFSWVGVQFVTLVLLNVPLVFAWYGFVGERLLVRLSPLVAALVIGLASVMPYQLGWWVVNARFGDWVPYDLPFALSVVGQVALAVPAVWLVRKARGSLLPTALLLSGGMVGTGVASLTGSSETSYVRAAEIYPVALVAAAVLFAVVGHMWQRPEPASRLFETGDMLPLTESR